MSESKAAMLTKKILELPPMPMVMQKLLSVVGSDRTSAKDVAEVLSTDQALAGKVLKLVNSSFYGFSNKISTISRAVVILGFSEVRNLALGLSSYEALKKYKDIVDWGEFWGHALSCAAGAQALASRNKYPVAEEAFVAGLLHDIGHFVICITFPEEYSKLLDEADGDLLEREKEVLGMSHVEVGKELLEYWKLPDHLCRVARFHHNPKMASMGKEPLITMTMIADLLACAKGSPFVEKPRTELLTELCEVANIQTRDFGGILSDIDKRIKEAKVFLSIADAIHPTSQVSDTEACKGLVALITTREENVSWVRALLEHFGHQVIILDSASDLPEDRSKLSLVMIDSKSIPETDYREFMSMSDDTGPTIVVLRDEEPEPGNTRVVRKKDTALPYLFSQVEVDRLIKERG